ncbi:MAG: xanthine dehydrogenase family protein molybdopterin-binding subunit [Spirochaetota bacterium]
MAKTVRQALKGRGDFISDVYVRDMLYGATIRSPYARALIRGVHCGSLPPGVICITAADVPGRNRLRVGDESLPLLAKDECRYVGEPVAVLAGPTQRDVVAAMNAVEVEYAELQPSYTFAQASSVHGAVVREARRGDPERALEESHSRVEGTYRTGIQEHLYNEPQGAVAYGEEDRLVVRTATQWPFHVRETVAEALGLAQESVVVRPADPGIALDGKLWYPSLVSAHAALLARETGRPVKLVYSNIEDFRFTPKRAPFHIRYTTGITAAGALHGARVEITYNAGAYPLFSDEICERVITSTLSAYECADLAVTVTAVRTNLPPLNVLSGFGSSAAFFATESHVARISEVVQLDPLAWRLEHIARRAPAKGRGRSPEARGRAVLERAAGASDFARKFAAYELQKKRRHEGDLRRPTHGIGIALGAHGGGFIADRESRHNGSVIVRLDSDGTALLRTSAVPASRAVLASWKSRIATILGLEPADVAVENTDTSLTPDSGPSTLSRNVVVVSQLVEQACNAIQKKRFRSPLPIEVRRSHRASRATQEPLVGMPFPRASYGAAVIEVGVDPVTFESDVRSVWLAVDAGQVLDEAEARRSLEMSVYQALEWATHEVVVYRNGAIDPRSYLAYRNISEPVLPQIHITLVSSPEKTPEGIGELPQNCIPAALAAAVSQATGRYMDQIPTNPALIHDYLESDYLESR